MKGESTLFPWAPLSLALCDNPLFMPEGLDGHHDGSATCSSLLLSITTQSLCSTYPVNTTVSNIFFFLFPPQKPFYTPYVLFDWEAKGCLGSREQKGEKKRSRLQTIFLFVQTHFSNAKPKQMLILQLPLKLTVS